MKPILLILPVIALIQSITAAPAVLAGVVEETPSRAHYFTWINNTNEQAKGFGGRLGVWLGPDGFGDTPQEEAARINLLTSLCRDHHFELFKMDAVCGQLRKEKQDAFIRLNAKDLPFTASRKKIPH